MTHAFRICKTRFLDTAMSGEGARIAGGRWNTPGLPVVYAASSLSLATLEIMVHLEEREVFHRLFSWFRIEFPEDLIESAGLASLPHGWLADETNAAARSVGDAWLRNATSAILAVPSAVTIGETNYLLNPAHPAFQKIRISRPQPFRPDPRLSK